MDKTDKLIEKYKKDMMIFFDRSIYRDKDEKRSDVYCCHDDREKNKPDGEIFNTERTGNDSAGYVTGERNAEHFGTLKVIVFAGNEAFPLDSALVEVSDRYGELLYSLLTDRDGIAENMKLYAPDRRNSESAGNKDNFSLYRVVVSRPGFATQSFDDVQVFDGVESIQTVFLQTIAVSYSDRDDDNG